MYNKNFNFEYLIVSEQDRKFGLSVNTVGFQLVQPNSPYPNANHPKDYSFDLETGRVLQEYQIVYITDGEGTLTLDSQQEVKLTKGSIFLIFPGQKHVYNPQPEIGWNEYYIGFEGLIIDNIVKNSFLSRNKQVIEIGLNEELVHQFTRAIEIAKNENKYTQQYLAGIVMHILGIIISSQQNKKIEKADLSQKIEYAKIHMNTNINGSVNLEELAIKLEMSYTHFRKSFKVKTGLTPARYFTELKILKAKQLLGETLRSVKEIAYLLGYNTPEQFHSQFKKISGKTPKEYRLFTSKTNN